VANVRQRFLCVQGLVLTTLNFHQIQRILDAHGPANLFKFIINPDDFAQSVENLFYLSFLIRDGCCSLDVESGEPIICTCFMHIIEEYSTTLSSRRGEAYAEGVR
jgi:hypothetical protein